MGPDGSEILPAANCEPPVAGSWRGLVPFRFLSLPKAGLLILNEWGGDGVDNGKVYRKI